MGIYNQSIMNNMKMKKMMAVITVILGTLFYTIAKFDYDLPQGGEYLSRLHNNYSLPFDDVITKKFIDSLNCSLEEYVAKYLLKEPSRKSYNIAIPTYKYNHAAHSLSWKMIDNYLRMLFDEKESGFFIEAGALDGLFLSNTLWLETKKKWSGLLVEPNPSNYQSLLKKNRKVWTAQSCMSTVPYPKISNFQIARPAKPLLISGKDHHDWMSRGHAFNMDIDDNVEKKFSSPFYHHDYLTALCLPIQYFLNALNVTVVDFFSLDIEGGELQVLKLFPWDKIQLRSLVVENKGVNSKDELINYMTNKGFSLVGKSVFHDYFFVMKSETKLLQKIIDSRWNETKHFSVQT